MGLCKKTDLNIEMVEMKPYINIYMFHRKILSWKIFIDLKPIPGLQQKVCQVKSTIVPSSFNYLISRIRTRLPASRSSSVGPEGCFSFCHPKVKGGGEVSFDKNENHGLEMPFKSFEVFSVYAVVFYPYPPPPHPARG